MSGAAMRVWQPAPAHQHQHGSSGGLNRLDPNVGAGERMVSAALGLSLIAFGLARRGIAGTTAAAAGGALLWHGAKKHSFAYGALGIRSDDATTGSHPFRRRTHSKVSMTIGASAEELFTRWRDLSQLPRVFPHVDRVVEGDAGMSEWRVTLPGGRSVRWTARITQEVPNRRLSWKSVQGSPFEHAGTISFDEAAGGRGTRVTLEQRYTLPAGALGVLIARVAGSEPRQEAMVALSRFKQLIETGEITDATGPSGRDASKAIESETHRHDTPQRQSEIVDEASDESFPASDPPSHGGSTATPSDRP